MMNAVKYNRAVRSFNYPHISLSQEESITFVIKGVDLCEAFIMEGAKFEVGVASTTNGLEMTLMVDGIKLGDEMILKIPFFTKR